MWSTSGVLTKGMGYCMKEFFLYQVQDHSWVIATPGFDVYIEVLDIGSNPDLRQCHCRGPNDALPAAVDPNNVYAFAGLTPAERQQLSDDGRLRDNQEWLRPGLGLLPSDGVAVPVGQAVVPQVPAPNPANVGARPALVQPVAGPHSATGVVMALATTPSVARAGSLYILDEPTDVLDVGAGVTLPAKPGVPVA